MEVIKQTKRKGWCYTSWKAERKDEYFVDKMQPSMKLHVSPQDRMARAGPGMTGGGKRVPHAVDTTRGSQLLLDFPTKRSEAVKIRASGTVGAYSSAMVENSSIMVEN